jgi:predicted chitinase
MTEGYQLVGGTYNMPFDKMLPGQTGHIDVGLHAWESAGWYWCYGSYKDSTHTQDLSTLADKKEIITITKAVAGSTSVAENRAKFTRVMYNVLTGATLNI